MERKRRIGLPGRVGVAVATVLGLVVAGACGGKREGAAPLGTVPSTTVAPATTTTEVTIAVTTPETTRVRTTTTVRRGSTTTTVRPNAVFVNGVPQVTPTPAEGGVGTRVRVEGDGFTDEQWRGSGKDLWLSGRRVGCDFMASARHRIRVSADGHLSGDFVVPANGECRQSDAAEAPVVAGTYKLAYSCTACFVGSFVVT